MNATRMATLVGLEMRQRLRSVAFVVLLSVFGAVLLIVTVLASGAFGGFDVGGQWVYSVIVMIVLLLALLVSPTLAGNAVNGDREAATLAPVQVTLATTSEILGAKILAAWLTGLAFAAVAVPFVAVAAWSGNIPITVAIVSIVVLVVEIGVVATVAVGLSGIIARPLFSVAASYLVVAALVIGTAIGFALSGTALSSPVTTTSRYLERIGPDDQPVCTDEQVAVYDTPRFDRVWWLLAPNPFVILADATPATYDSAGAPRDIFGQLAFGVRAAQIPPELDPVIDDCDPDTAGATWPTPEETVAGTTPTWAVGLVVQVVLAGALVWGAWVRTRTPARRPPPGTRIA